MEVPHEAGPPNRILTTSGYFLPLRFAFLLALRLGAAFFLALRLGAAFFFLAAFLFFLATVRPPYKVLSEIRLDIALTESVVHHVSHHD